MSDRPPRPPGRGFRAAVLRRRWLLPVRPGRPEAGGGARSGFARLAALLLAIGLLAAAAPVLAHTPSGDDRQGPVVPALERPASASPEDPVPAQEGIAAWLLLAALSTVPLAARRRSRRGLALVIVLVLLLFSFESSVHAVHHLGDREAASQCSVASASAHLAGTLAEPVQIDVLRCPAAEGPPLAARPAAVSQPHRPDAGRAPPAA